MPRRTEEVCYCDICKAKKEESDIFVEAQKPMNKAPNGIMGGLADREYQASNTFSSTFRFRLRDASMSNAYADGLICKDCVARELGFDTWLDLQAGAKLLKREKEIEKEKPFIRGGPFDR